MPSDRKYQPYQITDLDIIDFYIRNGCSPSTLAFLKENGLYNKAKPTPEKPAEAPKPQGFWQNLSASRTITRT